MVQWFNGNAIKAVLTRFCANHFRPALYVPNMSYLDYHQLKHDFDVVIFDKDNCLTRPYQTAVLEYPQAVKACLDSFGRENVAVLSNHVGCEDVDGGRLFGQIHGLKVINHATKKPGCMKDVQACFPQTPPHKMVLIGDRLSTDIFMAQANGMFGVLVDPITSVGDNWAVMMVRLLERLWLRFYRVKIFVKQTQHKYIKFIAD